MASLPSSLLQHASPAPLVALCPPTVPCGALAAAIEKAVKSAIDAHRSSIALPAMPWSQDLSYTLHPALAAYEAERLTGMPFGNDDFQAAIQASVSPGTALRAFPAQFDHASPTAIAAAMLRDAAARAIAVAKTPIRAALRCKVVAYPEDAVAVWTILAAVQEEGGEE